MTCCIASIRRWGNVIREFAESGQLLDLSVAFVIGNAFTKVMESLVDNLLTPILGFLFDGIAIGHLTTQLQSDRWPNKAPVIIPYGKFIQQLIYFVVITIILCLIITIVNRIYKTRREGKIAAERLPTRQELILMEHTHLLQSIAHSLRK